MTLLLSKMPLSMDFINNEEINNSKEKAAEIKTDGFFYLVGDDIKKSTIVVVALISGLVNQE